MNNLLVTRKRVVGIRSTSAILYLPIPNQRQQFINQLLFPKVFYNCYFIRTEEFLKMASGVTVSDVCKTTYEEIKKDKKHRYVIFFIKDEKQIDVEVIGNRDEEYEAFLNNLQAGGAGECRYGLYDFEYMHQCQGTSESSKKQKLFLMSWCPDTAKVKKKMLYSSSFDALKKSLVGVQKYIQATDLSEASQEAVEEKLRATDRQ